MNQENHSSQDSSVLIVPRCLTALPANIEEIIKAFLTQAK